VKITFLVACNVVLYYKQYGRPKKKIFEKIIYISFIFHISLNVMHI